MCLALFALYKAGSHKTELIVYIAKRNCSREFFCCLTRVVKFQTENQITVTQMNLLNIVCSILHTDCVHLKKAHLSSKED